MITVINKANKGLYNQLFQDVQNWLYTHNDSGEEVEQYSEDALLGKVLNPDTGEEEGETITSLEELFEYMYFITNFAPIYTRLPLDEEPFFIDADSRSISVPKDFATNGVSVQGDEVAEILFFKVNRFFDATDLSRCKIFIQWKSSETDKFGNQKEGVSRPWIQDIVSEPGYLIFGWPISSKITKVAGNVTFSVRFYRLDDADKLVYSFSTLDQTVKIQPALDYDIEDIVGDTPSVLIDDMSSNIMLRAINSPASSTDLVAMVPYWEDWVVNGLKGWTQKLKTDNTIQYEVMNLGIDDNGFSTLPVQKYIAALSDDSGVVSYFWTKVDKHGVGSLYRADGETKFYLPVVYRRIDDPLASPRLTHKTYYTLENDRYKPIPNSTEFSTLIAEDKDIYELVSEATLDEVGKYVAKARNRVGKVFSDDLVATAIYVPMPVAPELGELAAGDSTGPILRFDKSTDQPIPVTLDLEVTLKDEFGNDVAGQGGKATYVWRRRGLGDPTPEVLENDTDAELILVPGEDEEGFYSVIVSNNLNKEHFETTSNEVRITNPAAKLILTIDNDDDISLASAQSNGLHVDVAGLEPNRERLMGDDVIYQWYRYYSSVDSTVEADKAAAERGEYTIKNDVKIENLTGIGDHLSDPIITSSKTPDLTPPIAGVYFCEVTNIFNGTSATTISPFYTVVD